MWTNLDNTYYTSYIDFDSKIFVGEFWKNSVVVGKATWDFQNTLWSNSAVLPDDEELDH